jgi:hypothetical protein
MQHPAAARAALERRPYDDIFTRQIFGKPRKFVTILRGGRPLGVSSAAYGSCSDG